MPGYIGKAAKSCPFYIEVLFCLNGVFQIYYCTHVTFYSIWQHCDRLQRALIIRIDYFTMGCPTKVSDWSKTLSNPADSSHKAPPPVFASYLLQHPQIKHHFTPIEYQQCITSPLIHTGPTTGSTFNLDDSVCGFKNTSMTKKNSEIYSEVLYIYLFIMFGCRVY